jgi:flagellar capping protein FliD
MASEAQIVLDRIKKLTRVLQKTEMFQTDPVAQKLNAKFTGLLGKLSSYVNQNTASPTPDVHNPAPKPQSPTRSQAPQGKKVAAASESIRENVLRSYIRNLVISELTAGEIKDKEEKLQDDISDLETKININKQKMQKLNTPLEKKLVNMQKQKTDLNKQKEKLGQETEKEV